MGIVCLPCFRLYWCPSENPVRVGIQVQWLTQPQLPRPLFPAAGEEGRRITGLMGDTPIPPALRAADSRMPRSSRPMPPTLSAADVRTRRRGPGAEAPATGRGICDPAKKRGVFDLAGDWGVTPRLHCFFSPASPQSGKRGRGVMGRELFYATGGRRACIGVFGWKRSRPPAVFSRRGRPRPPLLPRGGFVRSGSAPLSPDPAPPVLSPARP